jgi:hypothetical protein
VNSLNQATLSSIIGDIYECALEPSGWTGVTVRIAAAMNAAYATIALANVDDNQARFAARSTLG